MSPEPMLEVDPAKPTVGGRQNTKTRIAVSRMLIESKIKGQEKYNSQIDQNQA